MTQKHHHQDYSVYRTLSLNTGHTVINTNLYPRPETISRDFRVLSWVFSESPRLTTPTTVSDALTFLTELYSGWYPNEPETEYSLTEATCTIPSALNTQHITSYTQLLEAFFAKYMEHYDVWAKNTTQNNVAAFKTATILKDVIYQHAFVHQATQFDIEPAYQDAYDREFSVRTLSDDVTWETNLITTTEYDMANKYLSSTEIAAVEDYVGALVELLDWESEDIVGDCGVIL